MKYLTAEQVLFIHARIIHETGGSDGLRDLSLLQSALARPQASYEDQALYPSLLLKAAALFQSLVQNHPFVDGNKRVGLTATFLFLQINGVLIRAPQDDMYSITQAITQNKMSIEEIADWLKAAN